MQSCVSVVTNPVRLKRKRFGTQGCRKTLVRQNETIKINNPINKSFMKYEFKVEGMMCNHCRTHVENVLNGIEGLKATVTLNPPIAVVECDYEPDLAEL